MVALAEDANVTRQALYNVVSGESGSPRLRAYIETRYPEVIEAHPWV
jgi:DNA-binding phage protein